MILESRSESTSQRGLIGMTAVLNALVARGYEVLLPWGDHRRYDLAFVQPEESLINGELRLMRVQCKVARLSPDGGYITVNPYNIIPGEKGRRSVKRGYLGDAEYFGVYSPDTGKVYLILVSEVPGTWDVKLRIKKSKNNQEKGVRWAYKYEL